MIGQHYDIDIHCPICGSKLDVYDDITYDEFDGDIIKDVDVEYDCPNQCPLANNEIDDLKTLIEQKIFNN